MKRWFVGAFSLGLSLFGLVGNLAAQAQVNVNQMTEEFAGANEKEQPALRISNSKRSRVRGAKMHRFIGRKFNFSPLPVHHHEASLLRVFTPPPLSSTANLPRQVLPVFRI